MSSEKFKVTNTTVKPVRMSDGKDLRTAVERKGHAISFRDERNTPIMLQAGQSTITSNLDSGLLGLQRGGFIKVEKIDDITTALQEHAYKPTNQQHNAQVRKARTAQMGIENYKQNGGSEHEGAVNPDGDPNFLVKAGSRTSKKPRQKRGINESASRNNSQNGKG